MPMDGKIKLIFVAFAAVLMISVAFTGSVIAKESGQTKLIGSNLLFSRKNLLDESQDIAKILKSNLFFVDMIAFISALLAGVITIPLWPIIGLIYAVAIFLIEFFTFLLDIGPGSTVIGILRAIIGLVVCPISAFLLAPVLSFLLVYSLFYIGI